MLSSPETALVAWDALAGREGEVAVPVPVAGWRAESRGAEQSSWALER